ncbi:hypothetical protein ACFLY5_01125, partial [Patescibacteria group bacterium]
NIDLEQTKELLLQLSHFFFSAFFGLGLPRMFRRAMHSVILLSTAWITASNLPWFTTCDPILTLAPRFILLPSLIKNFAFC